MRGVQIRGRAELTQLRLLDVDTALLFLLGF